jgi:hypothetical protein
MADKSHTEMKLSTLRAALFGRLVFGWNQLLLRKSGSQSRDKLTKDKENHTISCWARDEMVFLE